MYARRQLRLALRAGAGWNFRHPFVRGSWPPPRPVITHHAKRRQCRGARQLRARCRVLFPKFGLFRKRMGSCREKSCTFFVDFCRPAATVFRTEGVWNRESIMIVESPDGVLLTDFNVGQSIKIYSNNQNLFKLFNF